MTLLRRGRARRIAFFTAMLLAGAGFGCDGGPTAPGGEEQVRTPVARVELSRTELTLGVGDSAQAEATVRGSAGELLAGRVIEWSSGNVAVAMVSSTGLLRALAPGAAVVTARSEGQLATLVVSVLPAPAVRVVLTPEIGTVNAGYLFHAAVSVFDATGARVASPNLSVRSADTSIARTVPISPNGLVGVEALREGATTITVRASNPPGLSPAFAESSVSLTVGPATAARVEVSPSSASVAARDSVALAAATFSGAGKLLTGRAIIWRSSDPSIATVSQWGWVRGVAPGTASITAEADGRTGAATVTVTPATGAAPTLEIRPARPTMQKGAQLTLAAVFDPPVDPQPALTWQSSDAYVATISSAGVVTANHPGETTITVAGGGLSAYTLLRVSEVPVARIAVSLDRPIVTLLFNSRAEATLFDAQGQVLPVRELAWSTSDPRIATVREDGYVTPVAPGTVAIIATSGSVSGSATLTVFPLDTVPPEILDVSFTPSQVDVTASAQVVTARVHLRDTGSGIDSARTNISLTGPRGGASCRARTLVSGTRHDGTWECTIRVSESAYPGQWTPGGAFASDFAYNNTTLSAEDAARLSPGVTVSNANADVTPPTITGVTFSPASVDITGHAATTTITVSAFDAGSGVDVNAGSYLMIEPSAGAGADCFVRTLVSGTTRDGRWSCTVEIPQWSRVGEWRVRRVVLYDANRNRRELDAASLEALPTLTVTGPAPDVTAPSLTSITLSPTTVQKGSTGADVTVTLSATDDLRGLSPQGSYAVLRSPSRGYAKGCNVPQLVSGTPTNGTWRCVIHFDPGDDLGTWTLDQVTLTDVVGNRRDLLGADAQALFPGGITVQP